jgi:phage N-6-adenine-methyltransferase
MSACWMLPVTVMVSDIMFSSGKDDWQTPPELFMPLHQRLHFVADMAANRSNALLPQWYGPGSPYGEDALSIAWPRDGWVWCNPPYSRQLQPHFIRKAAREAQDHGVRTVMLLPARTDTIAFHRYIYQQEGVTVEFLKGRLQFVGAAGKAPFPSMLVSFQGEVT